MRVMINLDVGIINRGSSGFVYDEGSVEKASCYLRDAFTYSFGDFLKDFLNSREK